MTELITTDLVVLDARFGEGKDAVIRALAHVVADAGRSTNPDGLADDAFAREAKSATGMPGGLAIPHCRSEHVTESTLAFARLAPPVEFGAKDGAADLVFMIAAPASGDQEHMKLLTKLARALVRKEFTAALRAATSREQIVALVSEVVSPASAASESSAPAAGTHVATQPDAPAEAPTAITIVAVTACPTGIAHTYLAAEALANAGKKAGVNVVVEPQGSVGAETIDPAVITSASAVIFATDVGVRNKERFAGLAEINASVKSGIHDADKLVARAVAAANDPNAARVSGTPTAGGASSSQQGQGVFTKTPNRTADRRQLHDPVCGRRRFAHCSGVPARRLPGRSHPGDLQLTHQPAHRCSDRRGTLQQLVLPVPGRCLSFHRQGRLRTLRPGAGWLHRLRDR